MATEQENSVLNTDWMHTRGSEVMVLHVTVKKIVEEQTDASDSIRDSILGGEVHGINDNCDSCR